jgi:hypothetical protein
MLREAEDQTGSKDVMRLFLRMLWLRNFSSSIAVYRPAKPLPRITILFGGLVLICCGAPDFSSELIAISD